MIGQIWGSVCEQDLGKRVAMSGIRIWGEYGAASKASLGFATGASRSLGLPVPGPGSEVMFCN